MYAISKALNEYFKREGMRGLRDKIQRQEPLAYKEIDVDYGSKKESRQVTLFPNILTISFKSKNGEDEKEEQIVFETKKEMVDYINTMKHSSLIHNDCF